MDMLHPVFGLGILELKGPCFILASAAEVRWFGAITKAETPRPLEARLQRTQPRGSVLWQTSTLPGCLPPRQHVLSELSLLRLALSSKLDEFADVNEWCG